MLEVRREYKIGAKYIAATKETALTILVDILYFMRKYKIEPKEIRFIYSNINDAPKMVLIKGVKNGKAFLKFRENLYIYNEDGKYTDEIYKIYGKEK